MFSYFIRFRFDFVCFLTLFFVCFWFHFFSLFVRFVVFLYNVLFFFYTKKALNILKVWTNRSTEPEYLWMVQGTAFHCQQQNNLQFESTKLIRVINLPFMLKVTTNQIHLFSLYLLCLSVVFFYVEKERYTKVYYLCDSTKLRHK